MAESAGTKSKTTRLFDGTPAIFCECCKGCGQERYKVSALQATFNVSGGRYEGDLFIRKCIKCDGLGAIQDARAFQQTMPYTSPYSGTSQGVESAPFLDGLISSVITRYL